MTCCTSRLGILAATTLVALRVGIGYHFFKEGYSHYQDPKWSSEGFRRGAKGPLVEWYQQPLTDFHDWNKLFLMPQQDPALAKTPVEKPDPKRAKPPEPVAKDVKPDPDKARMELIQGRPYAKWWDAAVKDWNSWQHGVAQHFGYKKDQAEAAAKLHQEYYLKLDDALAEYEADIRAYQHELWRTDESQKTAAGREIPYRQKRNAERAKDVTAEKGTFGINSKPAAWMAAAKQVEQDYQDAVLKLATEDQLKKFGQLPVEPTSLKKADELVTYSLIAIGACLMLGFLTPLAALGGVAFLLTVVGAQPPWIAGTQPTYNQIAEILGLLVLAFTCAGRFAGLDFFIGRLFGRCCNR